jgi:16S rRNA (uracil1498-N3)-methyltransferase
MSERFYLNVPLAEGATVILEGPEAHHLARVCRLRPGAVVSLFNGDGQEYAARLVSIVRRQVTLEVIRQSAPGRELPFLLEIAAPLPKGDRAAYLVEKLTELGVARFVPLTSQRSVIQPRETRREKLERQVIEASKQCGRNRLMEVSPAVDWRTYCTQKVPDAIRVLAHVGAKSGYTALAAAALSEGKAVCAAVGPEGGFTEEEAAQAHDAGWTAVDLGPRTLRVETAALLLAAWALTLAQTGRLRQALLS